MLVSTRACSTAYRGNVSGFTLIQLLSALVIVGILVALALPGFQAYLERARQTRAMGGLGEIELAISEFATANDGQLPVDLTAVGLGGVADPWGNAWVYVNLNLGGAPRTDQDGEPINTNYDLYSLGPDGSTALSLTASESEDDIVRASNGGFVGVVSDYTRLD
jgi:general secretion pathway protein G